MESMIFVLVGILVTYVGGIPFGMINLAMIDISVKKTLREGAWFAVGASLVEILEASVALFFGVFVQQLLDNYQGINLGLAVVLVGVGIFFVLRKVSEEDLKAQRQKSTARRQYPIGNFGKGIVIALLNPQAVPFWVFSLTILGQNLAMTFGQFSEIMPLLVGIFLGKLTILMTFGIFSIRLKSRLKLCCGVIDKSLGVLFLILGVIQGVRFFFY